MSIADATPDFEQDNVLADRNDRAGAVTVLETFLGASQAFSRNLSRRETHAWLLARRFAISACAWPRSFI